MITIENEKDQTCEISSTGIVTFYFPNSSSPQNMSLDLAHLTALKQFCAALKAQSEDTPRITAVFPFWSGFGTYDRPGQLHREVRKGCFDQMRVIWRDDELRIFAHYFRLYEHKWERLPSSIDGSQGYIAEISVPALVLEAFKKFLAEV